MSLRATWWVHPPGVPTSARVARRDVGQHADCVDLFALLRLCAGCCYKLDGAYHKAYDVQQRPVGMCPVRRLHKRSQSSQNRIVQLGYQAATVAQCAIPK